MKNVLFYYYGINSSNIRHVNKQYIFEYQNEKYRLIIYDRKLEELEDINDLNLELLENGIPVHEIIKNNINQLVTYINQIPYILLKTKINPNDEVILSDIINFEKRCKVIHNYKNLIKNDWSILWSEKIDYFEYQMNQLSKKYPIIRESFGYFSGLAEISINLYVNLKSQNNKNCVSHNRIKAGDNLFDFYNPTSFVVDSSTRDATEFFKSLFLIRNDIFNEILYYIKYNALSETDIKNFFIRMMFPTFYFDIYEEIILGNKKEKDLLNIISLTKNYEVLLKQIYSYIKNIIYFPEIEMFNK